MSASIGRRACVRDSICLCCQTWVLVIHNDFKGIKKFERLGDDIDVRNLRQVFETQRGCRFRELHNCGSEEIVQTLAQEKLLIQLFHPDGDYNSLSCQPATFILFILSHGDSGGVILTNHFKKDEDPAKFQFETYNTTDVWNLAKMDFIEKSLKIFFLGPCRGKLAELIFEEKNKTLEPTLPGRLSSKPNRENLVILYATVETTAAHRYEAAGTWFVEAVCKELENLGENLPLLVFLTRIQFNISNRNTALGATNFGQTSQLHYFFHKKFTICASESFKSERAGNSLSEFEHTVDCVPQKEIVAVSPTSHWTDESCDAKAGNFENLVKSYDKLIYFDWLDQHGIQFKRGKALIFHDTRHYSSALKMGISLQSLGYRTRLHDLSNIHEIITNTRQKRRFEHDGSFVLCVLAQLSETEDGLVFENAQNTFQLSKIIDEYTGTKCTQLVGKPKLFFFLDDGVKLDGESKEKKEIKQPSSEIKRSLNLHAGVCTFVGVRSGAKETGGDVIENLVQALRSPQLKEEGFNLQTVLSEVIAKASEEKGAEDATNRIKPQFLSTLPQLLNFPPLQSPYELEKYNVFHRFFGAAWWTSFLFAFTLLILGFALRTEHIFPTRLLLVNLDESCGVSFIGSNFSRNDAFNLNAADWSKNKSSCSGAWRKKYSADYVIIDYLSSSDNKSLQNAIQQFERSANKRESAYRIVLFGYTRANLLKMIQFSSLLNSTKLKLDVLRSVVTKIELNRDYDSVAVLELSHVFPKEAIRNESHLLNSVQAWIIFILTRICEEFDHFNYELFDSVNTLSVGAQEQFVPLINVECYFQNISLIGFKRLVIRTKNSFPKYACTSYHKLFLEMEKEKQLGSAKAFQVRMFSESKTNATNQEENQKCKEVADSLKSYENAHMVPYLLMYEKMNLNRLYDLSQLEINLTVPYVVKMRYNGSLENYEKLIDFFDIKSEIYFVALLALAEEFKIIDRLASFESMNTFSRVNNEIAKGNSNYENLKSMAPFWIQEFMYGAEPVCDYGTNQTCTDSVIEDLGSILTDFETSNLTERREILFIDFVINSINNSSADTGRKLEPLAERVEPFREKMLGAMVQSSLGEITATNDGDGDDLLRFLGYRVSRTYLPLIKQRAQLIPRGIDLSEELLYYNKYSDTSIQVCDGVYDLYKQMLGNSINMNSKGPFFMWNYVYSLIEMPAEFPVDERFQDITFEAKEKCKLVLNGLRNYSEAGMADYERLFRQNDTQSLQTLFDWHNNHWFGAPWIIPQLIKRLHTANESIAFPVLHLLKKLPPDLKLCPGFRALSDATTCDKNCTFFSNDLCNSIPQYRQWYFREDGYFSEMCDHVKEERCQSG